MVFLGTKPTHTSIGWGDPRVLKVIDLFENKIEFLNDLFILGLS